MDGQAKKEGSQRVSLLNPLSRLQGCPIKEKGRRQGVTGEDIVEKLWDVLPRRFQHLVPSNAIKSVPEVELEEDMVRDEVVEVDPGRMGCRLHPQRCSESKLELCQ